MTDTPASVPEADPTITKKLPFGVEPWMLAAAIGLGAGVLLGVRLGQLLRGPQLPQRQPCPECARRTKVEAEARAMRAAHAPPVGDVPEGVTAPPPAEPAAPMPEPATFSAQAIPDADG